MLNALQPTLNAIWDVASYLSVQWFCTCQALVPDCQCTNKDCPCPLLQRRASPSCGNRRLAGNCRASSCYGSGGLTGVGGAAAPQGQFKGDLVSKRAMHKMGSAIARAAGPLTCSGELSLQESPYTCTCSKAAGRA